MTAREEVAKVRDALRTEKLNEPGTPMWIRAWTQDLATSLTRALDLMDEQEKAGGGVDGHAVAPTTDPARADSSCGPLPRSAARAGVVTGKPVSNPARQPLQDVPIQGTCKCGRRQAGEAHTCPFNEEINDDSESLCTCCDECTQECAWDI